MILGIAGSIAEKVLGRIGIYCDRVMIAGSIRRVKPEVKDIEIVCVPKRIIGQQGFFSNLDQGEVHPLFVELVNGLGKIVKGKPIGRYMQIELPEDIKLDLFMTSVEDYWRQVAIRTGSADYSHKVIATAWVKKGWVGTENGLRRRDEGEIINKKWVCLVPDPERPPIWKSEEEFFEWLGLEWLEPREREIP